MGLRFRKSVSLFPGVKLNFGTTGMSVSTGVPGFRKTFHTSGRVTTSVGIPGTGLYYVDTKNTRSQSNRRNNSTERQHTTQQQSYEQSTIGRQTGYDVWDAYSSAESDNSGIVSQVNNSSRMPEPVNQVEEHYTNHVSQLDTNALKSIHKASDDSIDWTEVLVSPMPPDETYNEDMWKYYHSVASKVLSGDIDTYLQLIYEVNPLDDLLPYGGNFEFGTDTPRKIEVEFTVNKTALESAHNTLSTKEYNNLLQDYICSVCIRIARDMFALLPVANTIVHAVLDDQPVLSVDFDRTSLSRVKFGYIDPSDTLTLFRHNMDYSDTSGFSRITTIE